VVGEWGVSQEQLYLERQLADAHARIREMIREIDRRDELIADLERRIFELESQSVIDPDHKD
jgi:hypothetical protein